MEISEDEPGDNVIHPDSVERSAPGDNVPVPRFEPKFRPDLLEAFKNSKVVLCP